MHRIDDPSAVGDMFNDNPAIENPTTRVTAAFMNDVQENLCQAIEGAGIVLDKGEGGQLLAAIRQLARQFGAPVGCVIKMDGSTCPDGYLALDGAEYLRADYPDLVAFYVADARNIDGSTGAHFIVPNYEGYFERAASSDASVDPEGPRAPGDGPQADANKSHTHTSPEGSQFGVGGGIYTSGDDMTNTVVSNPASGASGGAEARPKNVPLLWCVKT